VRERLSLGAPLARWRLGAGAAERVASDALMATLEHEHVSDLVTSFGDKGVSSLGGPTQVFTHGAQAG
jgi:hypothetical protein